MKSAQTDETDNGREKAREQRSQMHVDESLLRSRHSVGSESEAEKRQAVESDKVKEKETAV
jgi:hypothetical protein